MRVDVLLAVVVTSVLSSALTVVALALVARWYRRRRLPALLEEASDVLAGRVSGEVERAATELLPRLREEVRGGFEEAAEALLPRFKAEVEGGVGGAATAVLPELRGQVRGGFEEAAEGLLPRLRAEVREGFKEAMSEVLAGKLLGRAGEGLARKGSSVLEAGLDLIFGEEDEPSKR